MLFTTTGLIKDHFYILGLASYPVHLLDGERPVLFDAGITPGGRLYVEAIRAVLGKRQPWLLLISHSHWDHCGAVAYLKDAFPSLKVAASRRAAEVFKRPRALELMAELNESTRPIVASFPEVDSSKLIDEPFRPFEVDMEVEDGQVIRPEAGSTVEVFATPGHTRDHMSYYIPGEKILLSAEASGALDATGAIITEFLSDYDAYFSSLTRLARLDTEVLCQGHRIVVVGKDEVKAFFDRSLVEAVRFKERVYEALKTEEGDIDRAVARIKAEQYDTNKGIKQPEGPYLLNLRAQVTHLAGKGKPQ